MHFDGNGFLVKPDGGAWEWGLELVAESAGRRRPSAIQQNRLVIQHSTILEEWFVNDGRGLEQGWTLQARPGEVVNDRVRLHLAVRGGLRAVVSDRCVGFTNPQGATVVTYAGLKAWDATGRTLAARFAQQGENFAIEVDVAGAVYPVTIDPIAQQAYLKASNTNALDAFGCSVAISGDTAVVGAWQEDGASATINGADNNSAPEAGAAYVFVRNDGVWTQQAYLKASNAGSGDEFGFSVGISGDTIVVGARKEASSATTVNGNESDNSAGEAGAAYVFFRDDGVWTQQAYLKASNAEAGDRFGCAVAVSGNTVLVGANFEASASIDNGGGEGNNGAPEAGAAYVFVRNGINWSQQAYLKAHNARNDDEFGYSVAISGDTAVVGAWGENSDAVGVNNIGFGHLADSGAAYVFRRGGTTWSQEAYLKASNTDMQDFFGWSVAVDGDTAVVGAEWERSASAGVNGDQGNNDTFGTGAAYVFVRAEGVWAQQAYLKASNPGENDFFGGSVAVSGDFVVVGAVGEGSNSTGIDGDESNDSANFAGAVYVFARNGSAWRQQSYVKASNTAHSAFFGRAVAVDGRSLVVGASGEDSNAVGVNGDQLNDDAIGAGAAYVTSGLGLELRTIAKTGAAAPGAVDIAFSKPGFAAINDKGAILFDQTLTGAGATGGRQRAIFSTLRTTVAVDLILRSGDDLAGLGKGYVTGNRVKTLFGGVTNRWQSGGLFRATLGGAGISAQNNQALLLDNGSFVSLLRRTGQAVPELGGVEPSAFTEVAQAFDSDTAALSYKLRKNVAGAQAASDSGILVLNHSGAVLGATLFAREGSGAFGGGVFGQFSGRMAAAQGGRIHFAAAVLPAAGKPKQALFGIARSGTSAVEHGLQGATAPGAAPAVYSAFPAFSSTLDAILFRATLSGSPGALNEGIWRGTDLWLRKGVEFDTANYPGLLVKRIIRFWPVATDQMVAQVLLGGEGVKSSNNQALLLRQANGQFLVLLRSGQTAPGVDDNAVTVGAIQAVDVNPASGHYAVLGSLKGAPATSNQALWSGRTLGSDAPAEQRRRLPRLWLRKGDVFKTAATYQDTIRGLRLLPATDASGAGGRGLGQTIGAGGQIVLTLTGDRKTQEWVVAD